MRQTAKSLVDEPSPSAGTSGLLPDRCFTPRELASYWRTSRDRVRQLIRSGMLKAFTFGRGVRIAPHDVRECEALLAVQAAAGRRKRMPADIDPEVVALLEDTDLS